MEKTGMVFDSSYSFRLSDLMENMVNFLAELSMMHYAAVYSYCPSMIAASAVYAARSTIGRSPVWTDTLKHYTGYFEEQLSY
ncbi:hypothetical protein TSUD_351060 [Trifolium subterraneum]|uniref:Cyclin C-terminal domain-containing protein n=1 Tax=Trifolium subterraneum TaxID=3900 RepID=A0A2Z6P134_TRISU|nr:hypothetical protein TSUD_351060 [Trifolium subterraneum]